MIMESAPACVEYTDTLPMNYAYVKWIPYVTYEGRSVWVGCKTEAQKAHCLRLYSQRGVTDDLTFQEWIFRIGVNSWFHDLQGRMMALRRAIFEHVLFHVPFLDSSYMAFLSPQEYYTYYTSVYGDKAIVLNTTTTWDAFHNQLKDLVNMCVPVYCGPLACSWNTLTAGTPVSIYLSARCQTLCMVGDKHRETVPLKQGWTRLFELFVDYMRVWNEYMVYTIHGYESSRTLRSG